MKNWGLFLYGIALAATVALVFFLPFQMITPGRLIPAQAGLNSKCSSCHTAFLGARADKCVTCHSPATIGIMTSTGLPITSHARHVSFHQKLATQDCMSCHTDHPGISKSPLNTPRFSHALLSSSVRANCSSCHVAPQTALHASFKGQCSSCHTSLAWKPATFDHTRMFALTGPHALPCASCHVIAGHFEKHSCTSCHEHSPDRIAAIHGEEGITNTTNCVSCHRSASHEGRGRDREDD